MFELSFAELVVIAVVTLIVVGPERLPKVARTIGQWVGKIQRYANKIKQDIMHDESVEQVRGLHAHIRNDAGAVRQAVNETELTAQQMALQARYKQPDSSENANQSNDSSVSR